MSEWKDIKTAPKDGKPFLAITGYGKMCVMFWNNPCEQIQRVTTCRRCGGMGLGSLTHWIDLPQPPTTAKEANSNE